MYARHVCLLRVPGYAFQIADSFASQLLSHPPSSCWSFSEPSGTEGGKTSSPFARSQMAVQSEPQEEGPGKESGESWSQLMSLPLQRVTEDACAWVGPWGFLGKQLLLQQNTLSCQGHLGPWIVYKWLTNAVIIQQSLTTLQRHWVHWGSGLHLSFMPSTEQGSCWTLLSWAVGPRSLQCLGSPLHPQCQC